MRRFRQITAAITRRKYAEDRKNKLLVSWQTRTLALFIAGGYMIGEGENTGLTAAAKISVDALEKAMMDEEETAPPKPVEEADIPLGSFERLMGAFGNGEMQQG